MREKKKAHIDTVYVSIGNAIFGRFLIYFNISFISANTHKKRIQGKIALTLLHVMELHKLIQLKNWASS